MKFLFYDKKLLTCIEDRAILRTDQKKEVRALPDKTVKDLLFLAYLLLWALLAAGILAALACTVFFVLALTHALPEPLDQLPWGDWQVLGPVWLLLVTGCVLLGQGVRLLHLVGQGTPFTKKGLSALYRITICLAWAGVLVLIPFPRLTGDPFLGVGLGWLLAILFWALAAAVGAVCSEYRWQLEWNLKTHKEVLL